MPERLTRECLMKELKKIQEKLAKIKENKAPNYRLADPAPNPKPEYEPYCILKPVSMLNPKGLYMYYSKIEHLLEKALKGEEIPKEEIPFGAPTYLSKFGV